MKMLVLGSCVTTLMFLAVPAVQGQHYIVHRRQTVQAVPFTPAFSAVFPHTVGVQSFQTMPTFHVQAASPQAADPLAVDIGRIGQIIDLVRRLGGGSGLLGQHPDLTDFEERLSSLESRVKKLEKGKKPGGKAPIDNDVVEAARAIAEAAGVKAQANAAGCASSPLVKAVEDIAANMNKSVKQLNQNQKDLAQAAEIIQQLIRQLNPPPVVVDPKK